MADEFAQNRDSAPNTTIEPDLASYLDTDIFDTPPLTKSEGKFAHNMKVEKMYFHYGHDSVKNNPGNGNQTTNVLTTAVSIRDAWKKQAEALALEPVDETMFYRRQFNGLFDILSISLFGDRSICQMKNGQPTTNDATAISLDEPTRDNKEVKRKRNATSNDCEYIIFEKDGKFVYRRLESAVKYAKRGKIDRYICIAPRNDECRDHTKALATKLRQHDPKILIGNEMVFNGSYEDLYNELRRLICEISMDRFAIVKYIIRNATNEYGALEIGDGEMETDYDGTQPPPEKKIKKKESKKGATEKKVRTLSKADDVHRTFFEEETDSEETVNKGHNADDNLNDASKEAVESILNIQREIMGYNNDHSLFDLPPNSPAQKTDSKIGTEQKIKIKSNKKNHRDSGKVPIEH